MSFQFSSRSVKSGATSVSSKSIAYQLKTVVSAALMTSAVLLSLSAPKAFASSDQDEPRIAVDAEGKPIPVANPKPKVDQTASTELSLNAAAATTTAVTTLKYPYGVGLDTTGNIYVTNLFGGVNEYNVVTKKLMGSITAGLSFPAAVAVAFNGNIYVANNGGNNITIYNQSYTQIGTITDSTLLNPMSMYIDATGDIWVLDAAGTTHLYLFDGTPISSYHTGGTCIGPWGPDVTVWGISNGQGGYIEDVQNVGQAVHDGVSFPNYFPTGSPYAGGEAQDTLGRQYVTDVLHNQVQIWSPDSSYLQGTINTPATPYGIAVDSAHSRIFVVFTTMNEVYEYSMNAPYTLKAIIK